jgi:hypothetical protein
MQSTVLTGPDLDDLMNRLEADLEETHSGKEADLAARLRAQPLRADSIEAVGRLQALWMLAGDAAAARAVIDTDGARVLGAAPAREQPDIRMTLALYRLDIARNQRDENAIRSALDLLRTIVRGEPALDAARYRDLPVLELLANDKAAHAFDAIELQHDLVQKVPGRDVWHSCAEATRQCRRALAFQRLDRLDESRQAAGNALDTLAAAGEDQDVNVDDWLELGHELIEIAPQRINVIRQAVTTLASDWALPRRREADVRLARLAARASHAQGDLQAALAQCAAARYDLEADSDNCPDDFAGREVRWLVEAGHFEEAGRRAFFYIYACSFSHYLNDRSEDTAHETIMRIIHERLAQPDDASVWWPLCVMRACGFEPTFDRLTELGVQAEAPITSRSPLHTLLYAAMGQLRDQALRQTVSAAAAGEARRRAPDHPWTERLAAYYDEQANRIDASTALARLVAAAHAGDMRDWRTANLIFEMRARAHDVFTALAEPAPELQSGHDCYIYGTFRVDWNETAEGGKCLNRLSAKQRKQAQTRLNQLAKTVYEQGRARMERFFETGQGHPGDACAHVYSMLCNNLAIRYRDDDQRYRDSLELHRAGIAASPFIEHYDGVFWTLQELDDKAGMIRAAEDIWHFSSDRGVSGHNTHNMLRSVTWALDKLDRHNEMPLWLERFIGWQRTNGEDETDLSDDALITRLYFARYMGERHLEQARALYQAMQAQLEQTGNPRVLMEAGGAACYVDSRAKAKVFYERALRNNAQAQVPLDPATIASIHRTIQYCDEVVAHPQKPWWKFW